MVKGVFSRPADALSPACLAYFRSFFASPFPLSVPKNLVFYLSWRAGWIEHPVHHCFPHLVLRFMLLYEQLLLFSAVFHRQLIPFCRVTPMLSGGKRRLKSL